MGAISEAAGSLEEGAAGADAVVLAAPVPLLAGLALRALEASGPACVVTDLGSAKSEIMEALGPEGRERFIGGHPVCGAERSGVAFAREGLFRDATWFLTPGPEARPELFGRLHGLVASIGARPTAIDARVHDRLMALVSHLPHVLAGALINQAAGTAFEGREALRSAGPSFGDLTRVADPTPRSGPTSCWRTARPCSRPCAATPGGSTRWGGPWSAGTGTGCWASWATPEPPRTGSAASTARAGRPPASWWPCPNRPGAISEIATALGHAHINIEDLQLRPGRPEGEGELELALAGPEAAREAVRLVGERGYRAREIP